MKIIARIWAILTVLLILIAFIPLLGWLNWLAVPFAIIGLLLAVIGKSNGSVVICSVAIVAGILRLIWGWGII